MLETAVTRMFGVDLPIITAPMAGTATGRFAAAAAQAGALGMVAAGSSTPAEQITGEAAVARETGRPFGVGLMAWALASRPEQVDAALGARPALVSVSFGDYARWVPMIKDAGIRVTTQVGTLAEAREAVRAGVDLLVARGAEAGGHGRDAVATLPLLQAVLDEVEVPVVAAGGVATGRGLAAVLAAGAAGAWVGTALLASAESGYPDAAKERVLRAQETDTVYTRAFDVALRLGWPPQYGGRALRNAFTDRWTGREDELAADEAAHEQVSAALRSGELEAVPMYAGQAAGLVTGRCPVGEVVTAMAADAERLLAR